MVQALTYSLPALHCEEQLTQRCGTGAWTKKAYTNFPGFAKDLK